MDTIKTAELKANYPKTWEAIDEHGFKYYERPGHIKIRSFLERNGYLLRSIPLMHSEKYIPQIIFNGKDVGSDRYLLVNDFEPMRFKQAEKISLMFALKDFENSRSPDSFWD
jgi:hypothetical protein